MIIKFIWLCLKGIETIKKLNILKLKNDIEMNTKQSIFLIKCFCTTQISPTFKSWVLLWLCTFEDDDISFWKNEQHKRIRTGCDEYTFNEGSDMTCMVNNASAGDYQLSQPLSWGHDHHAAHGGDYIGLRTKINAS